MLMEPVNAPARYISGWILRILWDPHVLSSAKPMVIFAKEVSRTSDSASTTYTVLLARAKLPANADNFTCSSQVKRPHTQFTCVTCSLPVETSNYTCFYAASVSRRIHAIGLNKARKLQANLPAICRWIYPRCDSRLLAIAGNSVWNCRFFCLRLCGYFFSRVQLFLPAFGGDFYRQF